MVFYSLGIFKRSLFGPEIILEGEGVPPGGFQNNPLPREAAAVIMPPRNGPGPLASSFFVENTHLKMAIFLYFYKIIVGSRVIIAIFW